MLTFRKGEKARIIREMEEIKASVPINAELVERHRNKILALLLAHPGCEEKTGCGIKTVMVRLNRSGTRTFYLVRNDGSETDFSYMKCLNPPSNKKGALDAARYLVREQIKDFKDKSFNGKCELTGVDITYDNCHVDHIPPLSFDALFSDFCRSIERDVNQMETVKIGDMQIGRVFVETWISEAWQDYHRQFAKLRVVSIKANLSLIPKVKGNYGI